MGGEIGSAGDAVPHPRPPTLQPRALQGDRVFNCCPPSPKVAHDDLIAEFRPTPARTQYPPRTHPPTNPHLSQAEVSRLRNVVASVERHKADLVALNTSLVRAINHRCGGQPALLAPF